MLKFPPQFKAQALALWKRPLVRAAVLLTVALLLLLISSPMHMQKPPIAVLIRGHERGALSAPNLGETIQALAANYSVDLFVHTWNESEARMSYKELDRSHVKPISCNDIQEYLDSCCRTVATLYWCETETDADADARLVGETEGRVIPPEPHLKKQGLLGMPLLPWKRMWAGVDEGMRAIEASGRSYLAVLSIRIDNGLVKNSHANVNAEVPGIARALASVIERGKDNPQVEFPKDKRSIGADNAYAGTPKAMRRLIDRFNLQLDEVRSAKYGFSSQELLVPRQADILAKQPL